MVDAGEEFLHVGARRKGVLGDILQPNGGVRCVQFTGKIVQSILEYVSPYLFYVAPYHLLALATIILWVVRDGGREAERKAMTRWHFVGALVCLLMAVVSGESSFGSPGLIVCLHAVLRSRRDRHAHSSLSYLCWIPLVCVQLPYGLRDRLTERMTAASTKLASWMLDQQHVLHLRTADAIEVPGQKFTAGEVCGEPTLTISLVACCAIMLCVLRRGWLQVLPMLGCALCVAVVMGAGKFVWLASTWSDQNPVSAEVINYVSFAGAVLLFAFCDLLLSLLTDWVPLMGLSGINPISVAFDKSFQKPPRKGISEDVETGFPPWGNIIKEYEETFRPAFIWIWVQDFTVNWYFTRSSRKALLVIPVLCVVIVVGTACREMENSQDIAIRYKQAVTESIAEGRDEETELLLNRLLLVAGDMQLRHRLILQLVEVDRLQIALPLIGQLTSLEQPGNPETRVWLVKQSLLKDSRISLTIGERIVQLRTAVDESPRDAEAHRLLANQYQQQNQWTLAERHLILATELNAIHAQALAFVQTRLGRKVEDAAVASAREELETRLKDLPEDHATRIHRAILLARQGDLEECARLLAEGLAIEPQNEELRAVLAQCHRNRAQRRMRQPFGEYQAAEFLLQALELDNSLLRTANLLVQCAGDRAIQDARLHQAISTVQARLAGSESHNPPAVNERTLALLLAAAGMYDDAISFLPDDGGTATLLRRARLLVAAGRREEAAALLPRLKSGFTGSAADASTERRTLARFLFTIGQYRNVIDLLQPVHHSGDLPPDEKPLLCQSLVAEYDAATGDSGFLDSPVSLQQLEQALSVDRNDEVYLRLVQLSQRSGAVGSAARQLLTRLMADSDHFVSAYRLSGSVLVEQQNYEPAIRYLHRANALDPQNPLIMNNLAVAVLHDDPHNADKALMWIEQALQIVPRYPEFLATRGEIYVAQSDYDRAERDFLDTLKHLPQHQTATAGLVEIKARRGKSPAGDE